MKTKQQKKRPSLGLQQMKANSVQPTHHMKVFEDSPEICLHSGYN